VIEVTRLVSPSSSTTPVIRSSVSASRYGACCQSSASSATRSSAPGRCAITPAQSLSAANIARKMRRQGLCPPRRVIWRRTARSNRAAPSRRVRAKSPPSRLAITGNAAIQVPDRNGCRAVSSAAGQAHSSRSRICWICWTWRPASVISCSRRTPRCRSLAHVSPAGSGT
jgi:hypothetical protein